MTATARISIRSTWDAESRSLANLVSTAAVAARGETRGGLVWVEHINLVVGDRSLAERFYFEKGLGCTRDPSRNPTKGTMWANLGWQQFHLAEEAADDPPQAVRGAMGLALPRLDEAYARLTKMAEDVESVTLARHDPNRFTVTCPWGNVFHCYDLDTFRVTSGADTPTGAPKMATMHADTGNRLDVRGGPGIRYVFIRCSSAAAVAEEYANRLGNAVSTPRDDISIVSAGLGPVHFVFETALDDPQADQRMTGVHVCVYLNDFSKYYNRLGDLVFTNPRFRHLDTCDTLDEALASRTFRFAFPAVASLEHETRSLHHRNFLKHIKYNGPP